MYVYIEVFCACQVRMRASIGLSRMLESQDTDTHTS